MRISSTGGHLPPRDMHGMASISQFMHGMAAMTRASYRMHLEASSTPLYNEGGTGAPAPRLPYAETRSQLFRAVPADAAWNRRGAGGVPPRPTGRSGGERSPGARTPPRRQPRAATDHGGPAHPSTTGDAAPPADIHLYTPPTAGGVRPGQADGSGCPPLRAADGAVAPLLLLSTDRTGRAPSTISCARGRADDEKARARHATACRVCLQRAPATARGVPPALVALPHRHPDARRACGRGLPPPDRVAAPRGFPFQP